MDSVRGTLQKIMADAIRRMPAAEAVATAWSFVCGQAVAERTTVIDYVDGVLRVQVPDAAWRAQLVGMAPQYRTGITEYSGQKMERIDFLLPEEVARLMARSEPEKK